MRPSHPGFVFALVATALLALPITLGARAAFAQTRQVAWAGDELNVTQVTLDPLPDGGCSANWCGTVPTDDGPVAACTGAVSLRTAARRNDCQALAAAGTGRLLRALRFDVDAGPAP